MKIDYHLSIILICLLTVVLARIEEFTGRLSSYSYWRILSYSLLRCTDEAPESGTTDLPALPKINWAQVHQDRGMNEAKKWAGAT